MSLKRVFLASLSLLGICALPGCACEPPESTVFFVEQGTFDQMLALYGERGVPLDECELLCQPSLDGSGGSSGAEVGTSERVVVGCELTTINFEQGGVDCTFASECES
jgi:hypothetical protein